MSTEQWRRLDIVGRIERGDRPTDEPTLVPRTRTLRFEVRPATFAMIRQVQQVLADERGYIHDDDALIAAMCNAMLAGASGDRDHEGESVGRAKFQIATVTCPSCDYAAHDRHFIVVGTNVDHSSGVGTRRHGAVATEAQQALVTLRFPKQVAHDAVSKALERLGPSAKLEPLICEALRSA